MFLYVFLVEFSLIKQILPFKKNVSADAIWNPNWQNSTYHQYKFFHNGIISANDAQQKCLEHGGLLASINNKQVR